MKHKAEIEQRAEEALNSLDGINRASANAWLYTKVKNRLPGEVKRPWERIAAFLARPAVAIAGLFLVLLLNVVVLSKTDSQDLATAEDARQVVVDSESLIASSSSFDYEKLVQP